VRRARFTETRTGKILKKAEGGRSTKDVCRERGVSEPTCEKCYNFQWAIGDSNPGPADKINPSARYPDKPA
jgi:putative transposase